MHEGSDASPQILDARPPINPLRTAPSPQAPDGRWVTTHLAFGCAPPSEMAHRGTGWAPEMMLLVRRCETLAEFSYLCV